MPRILAESMRVMASAVISMRFGRSFLKESFVRFLWAGTPHEVYLDLARSYAEREIERNLLPGAMRVFTRHIENDDTVYIVTASMRDWVSFWAERYKVTVIGTELEVRDGRLTGRMATPNCRGAEKVARIKEVVDLSGYSKIFAYGNSEGDREMLSIADEAVYNWDHIPDL
jgi:HAD superfamily phosphoserine phosphatase-like hydrolase